MNKKNLLLQENIKILRTDLAKTQKEYSEILSFIRESNKEKDRVVSEIESLKEIRDNIQREIDSKVTEYEKKDDELLSKRADKISILDKQYNSKVAEIEELESRCLLLNNEAKRSIELKEQQEASINELNKTVEDLEILIPRKGKEVDSLIKRISELKSSYENEKDSLLSIRKEKVIEEEQYYKLIDKIDNLKEEHKSLLNSYHNLLEKLKDKERIESDIITLQDRMEILKNKSLRVAIDEEVLRLRR